MKMEKMDLLRILLKVSIEHIIFTANVKWKTIPQLGPIYTKMTYHQVYKLVYGNISSIPLLFDQRPSKTSQNRSTVVG